MDLQTPQDQMTMILNTYANIIYRHFEWIVFTVGLITLALMNPYTDQGISLCLLEAAGVEYCPGNGLGHSIAFLFRGNLERALEANSLGPIALIVIIARIVYLLFNSLLTAKNHNFGK